MLMYRNTEGYMARESLGTPVIQYVVHSFQPLL